MEEPIDPQISDSVKAFEASWVPASEVGLTLLVVGPCAVLRVQQLDYEVCPGRQVESHLFLKAGHLEM